MATNQETLRATAEQKGWNNLVWLGDILGDVPSNGLSTTTNASTRSAARRITRPTPP